MNEVSYIRGMVKEYMVTSNASTDPNLWLKLIIEETEELAQAIRKNDKENMLKEACDVGWVVCGFGQTLTSDFEQTVTNVQHHTINSVLEHAQKMIDLIALEIPAKNRFKAFERVYDNNMGRMYHFDEKGEKYIKYDDDGKIVKNPDYPSVDLSDLV